MWSLPSSLFQHIALNHQFSHHIKKSYKYPQIQNLLVCIHMICLQYTSTSQFSFLKSRKYLILQPLNVTM